MAVVGMLAVDDSRVLRCVASRASGDCISRTACCVVCTSDNAAENGSTRRDGLACANVVGPGIVPSVVLDGDGDGGTKLVLGALATEVVRVLFSRLRRRMPEIMRTTMASTKRPTTSGRTHRGMRCHHGGFVGSNEVDSATAAVGNATGVPSSSDVVTPATAAVAAEVVTVGVAVIGGRICTRPAGPVVAPDSNVAPPNCCSVAADICGTPATGIRRVAPVVFAAGDTFAGRPPNDDVVVVVVGTADKEAIAAGGRIDPADDCGRDSVNTVLNNSRN